jgi:hypothetical protein
MPDNPTIRPGRSGPAMTTDEVGTACPEWEGAAPWVTGVMFA